ncbi:unnamed protein product, partial [Didymodactylos carnosus]
MSGSRRRHYAVQ